MKNALKISLILLTFLMVQDGYAQEKRLTGQTVFAGIKIPPSIRDLDNRLDSTGIYYVYFLNKKPYTGTTYDEYNGNNLCREMVFENGQMRRQMGWYANGNVERDVSYKNGQPDGKLIGYFEDGVTKYIEENYVNGVQEGMQRGWNSDGSLRYEEHVVSGSVVSRLDYEQKGNWPGGC